MRLIKKYPVLCSAILVALAGTGFSPVRAQDAGKVNAAESKSNATKGKDVELEEVVVTGVRASALSAVNAKRDSSQIVDSIVAEDVGKMPDNNVAEALQRITGIQIAREHGDGTTVLIRGMAQVMAEVNGRPVFTAGLNNEATPSRILNFNDLPSELIARADVYKSPVADQIEGGIGGVINFTTRRPLDFDGLRMGASAKFTNSNLADSTDPSYSAYLSDRWDTSIGEFGAMVLATHQEHQYRDDGAGGAAPSFMTIPRDTEGNNLLPANPNGVGFTWGSWMYYVFGPRERDNASASFQWRPSGNLELFADFNYTELVTNDNVEHSWASYGIGWQPSEPYNATFLAPPTLATAANGEPYIVSGRLLTSPNFGSFIAYKKGRTLQSAVGGTWTSGDYKVYGEFYTVGSRYTSLFSQVDTVANNVEMDIDFTSRPGGLIYPSVDLLDLSSYTISKLNYAHQRARGTEQAAKLDVERSFESSFITKLKGGVRLADRTEGYRGGNPVFGLNIPATSMPELFTTTRYGGLLAGAGGNFVSRWLVPNLDYLKDPQALFNRFGAGVIPSEDPLQNFSVEEKSTTAYVMSEFAFDMGVPADGNIGVRAVKTKLTGESVTQAQDGSLLPTVQTHDDTVVLPSANLRLKLTDELFWRWAVSKVVARPEFKSLNPALFIRYNFMDGYAGNPNLPSMTAEQVDTSLEYYFSDAGYVSAAAFYKSVENFAQNLTAPEVIDGAVYQITRPQAAEKGTIKGVEFGYQQFYDFLPGVLSGLGLAVNATFIESEAPDGSGQIGRLPGLSKSNYNAIVMYEKGPLSMRLAYNWRSDYPIGYGFFAGTRYPTLQDDYGQWDGAVNYAVNDSFSVSLEGTNLTRQVSYQTFAGAHAYSTETDRRVAIVARYKY